MGMTGTLVLATSLVLFAQAGGAACLTASDLGRGVVVGFDNGDVNVLQRRADGYIQVDERPANGDPLRLRAHRGLYFVEEFQPGPDGAPLADTHTWIDFADDPATLPTPVAGGAWDGRTRVVSADGSGRDEQASYRFSAAEPMVLSGCSYDAVQVDVRYDWGDQGGMTLVYAFLPALGSAVLISSQFDGSPLRVSRPVTLELAGK